jgi:hypothetical protein
VTHPTDWQVEGQLLVDVVVASGMLPSKGEVSHGPAARQSSPAAMQLLAKGGGHAAAPCADDAL